MVELRVTPTFAALRQPRTLGGADKRYAVLNGAVWVAMMMVSYQISWGLVAAEAAVGYTIHRLLVYLTRQDPWFRDVYMSYNDSADRYVPGQVILPVRDCRRPEGFARGAA